MIDTPNDNNLLYNNNLDKESSKKHSGDAGDEDAPEEESEAEIDEDVEKSSGKEPVEGSRVSTLLLAFRKEDFPEIADVFNSQNEFLAARALRNRMVRANVLQEAIESWCRDVSFKELKPCTKIFGIISTIARILRLGDCEEWTGVCLRMFLVALPTNHVD